MNQLGQETFFGRGKRKNNDRRNQENKRKKEVSARRGVRREKGKRGYLHN